MEDAAATEHSEDPEAAKKDETAIAEAVTNEKTQIPEAATEHSESSKAIKEDKTAIPEAATEHSEIRRLPILANKKSRSGEAAKDHSETPEAACQEMKRPRKSGKGSSSQNQWKQLPIPRKHARTASPEHVLISERILMIRYQTALPQSMLSSMCSLGSNCLVRDASHLCSSENEHAEMRFQQILTQTCISISVPLS